MGEEYLGLVSIHSDKQVNRCKLDQVKYQEGKDVHSLSSTFVIIVRQEETLVRGTQDTMFTGQMIKLSLSSRTKVIYHSLVFHHSSDYRNAEALVKNKAIFLDASV